MTMPTLHATPRARVVLLEQVRAVGSALRGSAAVAGLMVGVATLFVAAGVLRDGDVIHFHPEHSILPGLVGLLLPVGVWKGEERFGGGFLWTLPVDRRRHALAKVFAGWVWLMAAVAVFALGLLGLALLTGGNVLAEETLRFIPPASVPIAGAPDASAIQTVRWTPRPLLWLVPFTAATVTYLLGSALTLGPRHPPRWMVGTLLGVFVVFAVLSEVGRATSSEWLTFAPSRLLRSFLYGPYGLARLLTAGTDLFTIRASPSTGETVATSRGLPDPGLWARATLLWGAVGLAALWAAASRHRERRRA